MQYKIKDLVHKLVKAIEQEDYKIVREIFSENIHNYITNKSGGVDVLVGCENYIKALQRMNFKVVKPTLSVTQIDVIGDNQALFMIEVNAKKEQKNLHNFATYLVNFKDNKITSMRMVEALPEYSDTFWNS